jgi:hypothetical protein
MKTMLSPKITCQNTPLNMNYFDKYLQLFPSKFYAWIILFILFLSENLPLCDQKKVVNPKIYILKDRERKLLFFFYFFFSPTHAPAKQLDNFRH